MRGDESVIIHRNKKQRLYYSTAVNIGYSYFFSLSLSRRRKIGASAKRTSTTAQPPTSGLHFHTLSAPHRSNVFPLSMVSITAKRAGIKICSDFLRAELPPTSFLRFGRVLWRCPRVALGLSFPLLPFLSIFCLLSSEKLDLRHISTMRTSGCYEDYALRPACPAS